MLGIAGEAEDVVQDAYLRYSAVPREEIKELKPYLLTVVTRLCMDQLKSARVRREQYIGPWLPEPMPGHVGVSREADNPEAAVDLHESISLAFLRLLERLSPAERAVFLLHDIFSYGHDEVAGIVGRSEAACRQLLSRAKKQISAGRPRFKPSPAERQRLTELFVAAATKGELAPLIEVLKPDAVFYSDGGGKVAAARNPIIGSDRVARLIRALIAKTPEMSAVLAEVNAGPAVLLYSRKTFLAVIALEFEDGLVSEVMAVINPDKLTHFAPIPG